MEDNEGDGDGHGDHDDDLGGVEAPLLVLHVVQEGVRQRLGLRHSVVRHGQARDGRHPREEYPHEGLPNKFVLLRCCWPSHCPKLPLN